jgi:predicted permease
MRGLRWFRGEDDERQLRKEVEAHLAERVDDLRESGLSEVEARRQARREFGNAALHLENSRQVWHWRWLDDGRRDLQYAVRSLAHSPVFAGVATLTLALGIGVSTTLFSVIDSAFFRALPYPNPGALVTIRVEEDRHQEAGSGGYAPSIVDVRTWRESGRVLSHVGVGRLTGFRPPIVEVAEPERLTVGSASEGLLEVFGIMPIFGRFFTLDDTRDGAPAVALAGHAYWQSRLGGTRDVIGRVIRIADKPVTIVGVLPAGFYPDTALWEPERFDPTSESNRGSGTPVYGRLRPGVSLVQAQEELTAMTRALDAVNAAEPSVARVSLRPLYEDQTAGYGNTITTLTCAVAFLLLIACVNVAGLLLARGTTRQAEMAVRMSIGAGRGRLLRQLLTESLLLSIAGGVLGVVLAWLALDALVALIPLTLPVNSPPTVNLRVLAWTATTSVVCVFLFGLVPAVRLSGVRLSPALATGGRLQGASGLSRRSGQSLIAIEVALAVVLLAGAGLMIRSFSRLLAVEVGFDPDAVLTMEVEPIDSTPAARERYYAALLTALRRSPGVAFAGAVDYLPLRGGSTVGFVRVENKPVNVHLRQVLPGYFEAIGLPARQGRLPVDDDLRASEPIVVINEAAARTFFPDGPAVGRVLQVGGKSVPLRVIGVVGDVRHGGPQFSVQPEAYRLAGHVSHAALTIALRARAGATISHAQLREAAQAMGPKVILGRIRYGSEWLSERVATPRRRAALLGLLSGFGLLLTLVGIFSITAYAVSARRQEIGVRMAFGARPIDVVGHIVRDAIVPVGMGLAVGMGVALFATRVISSFLFETTPTDPATFIAAAVMLLASALVAAWLPARRAARIDPVVALRAE